MHENTSSGLVFVVDDNESNVRLLAHLIKREGYDLMVAFSGESALTAIQKKKPDLILLDIMMPGMDGFEVCRRLKTDSEYKNIPIIFLSALSDQETIDKAMELGGAAYLTKPFQREEVLEEIRTHLKASADIGKSVR